MAKRTKKQATKKPNAYQRIADDILALVEQTKILPWQMPFVDSKTPRNVTTGKAYNGVNRVVLSLVAYAAGYDSGLWLTYKQAQDLGTHVKKGEKGTGGVYFSTMVKEGDDGKERAFSFAKRFTVFHVSQCEPCEKLQELIDAHTVAGATVDVDAQAERIAAGYKNPPSIVTGGAAFYRPAKDEVTMPARDAFISTSAYYATLFHELAHSTGHTTRLNRAGITDKAAAFGSDVYSEEECVAELAAAFLCGEAGIEIDIERHAAYVDGWSKKLREDPSMLPRAAAAAEKAANHIRGK